MRRFLVGVACGWVGSWLVQGLIDANEKIGQDIQRQQDAAVRLTLLRVRERIREIGLQREAEVEQARVVLDAQGYTGPVSHPGGRLVSSPDDVLDPAVNLDNWLAQAIAQPNWLLQGWH